VVSIADEVVPTANEEPSIPSPTPFTSPPQPSQDIPSTSQKLERRNKVNVLKLRRLQKDGTAQRIDTPDDTVIDDDVAANPKADQDAEVNENTDIQGRIA
nr:hypothetical protein [Tanacetum cinerariifolium]